MKALSTFFLSISTLVFNPTLAQNTIFVNASTVGGAQDGTSWNDAFADLRQALLASSDGDEIWVAEGIYTPTDSSRQVPFFLPFGVRLYGGFDGTEDSLGQRDWSANETILSGDVGVLGDSLDNSYTILLITHADTSTLVDGFTFQHGNADDVQGVFHFRSNGGAIYIGGTSVSTSLPRINNCRFENNNALFDGGAVYVRGSNNGSVAPQFYNCHFTGNTSGRHGAGVCKSGGSNIETKNDFWKCTFQQNYAGGDGGGVFYGESEKTDTLEFTDCRFIGNTAYKQGGGISIWGGRQNGSKAILKNCEFAQNLAILAEGGDFHYVAANFLNIGLLVFDSCYFHDINPGSDECIYVDALDFWPGISRIVLSDCVFQDNHANPVLLECYDVDSMIVERCRFEGNKFNGPALSLSGTKASHIVYNSFVRNGPVNPSLPGGAQMFRLSFMEKVLCANNIFFDNILTFDGLLGGSIIDTLTNCLIWNRLDTISTDVVLAPLGDVLNKYLLNCIVLDDPAYSSFETLGATHVYLENTAISNAVCPVLPGPINSQDQYPPFVICGTGTLIAPDHLLADTAAGDYRLHPCSPARNAGNNAFAALAGLTTDIDGNGRILENTIDMGPFEMPPYGLTFSNLTDSNCDGDTLGTLALDAPSGCPPYSLEWNGNTAALDSLPFILTGLPEGPLDVTLNDSQGRTDSIQTYIEVFHPMTVEAHPTQVICGTGELANANFTFSGGAGKPSFEWSTGATSAWIINQPPGTYAVTATDALGCTAVDSFEIVVVGSIEVGAQAENISCFGETDGSATVVPVSGTAPFTVSWQDSTTNLEITGLSSGNYAVTVTDMLGCTGEATAIITEPGLLTLELVGNMLLCADEENGLLAPLVEGGTLGYSFLWENGDADSLHTNLPQGDYALTVTDANGCTATGSSNIEESLPIEITFNLSHATEVNNPDGTIVVTDVSGGVPAYSYAWNTGDTTLSLQQLPPGDYTLTITDTEGCQEVFEFTVELEVATISALGGIQLELFPNPVHKGGQVWLTSKYGGPVNLSVRLLDVWGRGLFYEKIQFNGKHIFEMPEVGGTYLLVLENEMGKRAAFRIVVD